jgi:hypothetical protein
MHATGIDNHAVDLATAMNRGLANLLDASKPTALYTTLGDCGRLQRMLD